MDQPRRAHPQNRDIIVIGASAGGLAALRRIVPGLPASLPASLFIVVHIGENVSRLHELLGRSASMPVSSAKNGVRFEHGHAYIAPADRHLLVHDSHILLRRSAHENLARPAIDPLFRSAAASFGSRVIGIVLSGTLSDGSAGLRAIKRCGGIAIVQDPHDAEFPSMPRNALVNVEVDHCVPSTKMADLIARLAAEPAGSSPPIPLEVRIEAAIAAQEPSSMNALDKLGKPSRFTCPECGGELWEIADGPLLRFRCHVGHAYTAEAVQSAQAEQIEHKLWELLRTHQERSEFAHRWAQHERSLQNERLSRQFEARARSYEQNAALIRELLREGNGGVDSEGDADRQTEAEMETQVKEEGEAEA